MRIVYVTDVQVAVDEKLPEVSKIGQQTALVLVLLGRSQTNE